MGDAVMAFWGAPIEAHDNAVRSCRAALDMLAIMGCDRCQGYFISRAIPASDIENFATQWNRDNPASSFTTLPRAVV